MTVASRSGEPVATSAISETRRPGFPSTRAPTLGTTVPAATDAAATDAAVTDAAATDAGPVADAGSESAAAPVSFTDDVMPIFQQSCTLSATCHGQANNAGEENLYLGENEDNTPSTIAPVYAGLGRRSP